MQPPSTPRDVPSPLVTHASLGLAGEALDPHTVASLLGIQPHRMFRRGDQYEGRDRAGISVTYARSSGIWALDSTRLVASRDPADHVRAIVGLVYPVRERWIDIQSKGFVASLWVVHAREEGEMGYTLGHSLLQKIADLRADLSITCNVIPSVT